MSHDEHELMVEYSEMTAFNFNSKEYQEVRKDFMECKDAVHGFEWFTRSFMSKFTKVHAQLLIQGYRIMSNKKDYLNKCFSPNWIEVDLENLKTEQKAKEVLKTSSESYIVDSTTAKKEASLESNRRKDLNTLLKELDEIKQSIERAAEKQHRLANLMGFYTGEFAQ